MELSSLNQYNTVSFGRKDKVKKEKNTGGVAAYFGGSIVGGLIKNAGGLYFQHQSPKINNIPPEDVVIVHEALKKALKSKGLADKGVEIIRVKEKTVSFFDIGEIIKKSLESKTSPTNINPASFINNNSENKEALELLRKEFASVIKSNPLTALISKLGGKKYVDNSIELISKQTLSTLETGRNAFTLLRGNKILLPESKLSLSGFHEIGHSLNTNFSKVGKALQKMRPMMMLSPIVLLIGAFGREKPESENKVKNAYNKTINFIRNHAGLLALGAGLPMLIEEGMASFNGNKIAKNLLSAEMAKKVFKTNRAGFLSYLGAVAGSAIAADVAVRIKNHKQNKHHLQIAAHNAVVTGQVKQ